jgi:hypothetical protein
MKGPCRPLLSAIVLTVASKAGSVTATTTDARCDDYRIHANVSAGMQVDSPCGGSQEQAQRAVIQSIMRIDPAAEAGAAARRGDFRLAAVVEDLSAIDYPEDAHVSRRVWNVEGVECRAIDNANVIIWLPMSNALVNATQIELHSRMLFMRRAYNIAMVRQSNFPKVLGCK